MAEFAWPEQLGDLLAFEKMMARTASMFEPVTDTDRTRGAAQCRRLGLPEDLPVATLVKIGVLLADRDHRIQFRNDGWTIEHPLSERLDGTLLGCPFKWTDGDIGIRGTWIMYHDDEYDEFVLGDQVES